MPVTSQTQKTGIIVYNYKHIKFQERKNHGAKKNRLAVPWVWGWE